MQILSYETFNLHELPENHPYKDVLEDSNFTYCAQEHITTLHQGMALIPIEDVIASTPNILYLCPVLDRLVIEYLNYQHHNHDQPDHDPSVLYNWIQKSLKLPQLNFNKNWTLTSLAENNPPLLEYLKTHNIVTVYGRPSRTLLLHHIHSLGINKIEFEFLFTTKE